ncbi:P-loop containing nucleoside triphosphate hydrolase protein [Aspergillus carlsbadensis]|nr:P-loop containing nucleoside triphosphate hydrolase protein [Aspergillus carlsbadensis]
MLVIDPASSEGLASTRVDHPDLMDGDIEKTASPLLHESQPEPLPPTSATIEDDTGTGSSTAIEEGSDHDVAKKINENSTDAAVRPPDDANKEHPNDDDGKDRDDKNSTDVVERPREGGNGDELKDDGESHDGEKDHSESDSDGNDDDGSDDDETDFEDAAVNHLPKEWWSVFDDWEPTHASSDKEKEEIEFAYTELEGLDDKVDSIPDSSPSRLEWLDQKQKLQEPLDRKKRHLVKVLDRVMCLSGHEDVKKQFLSIKARIEAGRARSEDLKALKPNLLILGGPETEQKVVAMLYAELLASFDLVPRTAGRELDENESWWTSIEDYHRYEASDSSSMSYASADLPAVGSKVFLIHRSCPWVGSPPSIGTFPKLREDRLGKTVMIMTAPAKDFGDSNETRWQFPHRMTLDDDEQSRVYRLLVKALEKRKLHVEGGLKCEALLTVANRIGGSSDSNELALNRCITTEVEQALQRQATRLQQQFKTAHPKRRPPNYFFLLKEDLIGPEPKQFSRENSPSWKALQGMVDLENVKQSVERLVRHVDTNRHRQHQGKAPIGLTLNQVIMGPPGTGKTTVAKLYGRILGELGLVSLEGVVVKTPTDFIGEFVGHSEEATKNILKDTEGMVLIIDDAHMLYQQSTQGTNDSDQHRRAVVDTLVGIIQNQPSDKRCVILVGYEDLMEEFLLNSNPGLKRRFPLDTAIRLPDYKPQQLIEILDLKMARDEATATKEAKRVAHEMLALARYRPNFGNGGDVENLLSRAMLSYQTRVKDYDCNVPVCLEPQDFDPKYNRTLDADQTCKSLFSGLLGMENLYTTFRNYQRTAIGMRRRGINPQEHIPFTFIFKGSPGTGKTTVARAIGELFYEMGFLSTTEVIECSATQMIGEYLGHTGPKVTALLERALGKVLFIDEAYRLADGASHSDSSSGTSYTREAIGELVDSMTKPRYARKMVIVMAGYPEDMNRLLRVNPGLRSRFPSEIHFPSMPPKTCLEYLEKLLSKYQIRMPAESDESPKWKPAVSRMFTELAHTHSWANARDVEHLARTITSRVFQRDELPGTGDLCLALDDLVAPLREMLMVRAAARDTNGIPGNVVNGTSVKNMTPLSRRH